MAGPILVVIGVQERLFNVMDAERRDDLQADREMVTSTETVVCQWRGGADSDSFRELSALLR